eukprot:3323921-Pleurochrysis_carterae.AAC.2
MHLHTQIADGLALTAQVATNFSSLMLNHVSVAVQSCRLCARRRRWAFTAGMSREYLLNSSSHRKCKYHRADLPGCHLDGVGWNMSSSSLK